MVLAWNFAPIERLAKNSSLKCAITKNTFDFFYFILFNFPHF